MSYAAEVLVDTPDLYWELEDTSGTTVPVDSSGNSRDAAIIGTINPGFGQTALFSGLGTSVGLNGTGGSNYIKRAYDSALNVGTGDFALELLVLSNNNTSNYVEVGGRDDAASGNGVIIYLRTGSGYLHVWVAGVLFVGSKRVSDGAPHHVVVTRISGIVYVYMDRDLQVSGSAPNTTNVGSGFRVGVGDGSYATLNGRTGHWAWYTHGLSAARVGVHAGELGFPPYNSKQHAFAYIYENVGLNVINTKESDASIYENVGFHVVNTQEASGTINENVGVTSPNTKEATSYIYEDVIPLTMRSKIGIPI